jgi:uncharacterized protein with gpF-like domain
MTINNTHPDPFGSLGKRANPGEDFNCRCVASPVLVYDGVSDEDEDDAGVKGGFA